MNSTEILLPCGHRIDEEDLFELAGHAALRHRKKPTGGLNSPAGGRPRNMEVPRCECGQYTAKSAKARCHKCGEEK